MRLFFSILAVLVATSATPSFADSLWDACHALGVERGVDPAQGGGNRLHYNRFMHECLAGKIPLAAGPIAASSRNRCTPACQSIAGQKVCNTYCF
jgi:hypothetical protein